MNKQFDYRITTDHEYILAKYRIPPELTVELESLRSNAEKGGKRIIRRLEILIDKYPHVPHLKNYLSCAYESSGMKNRAFEENQRLLRDHSDYPYKTI